MDQKDSSTNDELRSIIVTVEERQKKFHTSIQKKKGGRIDEKGAIECKTYEEFAIYWATVAGGAETRLSSGRRKGWRKWSKRYTSFANGVDEFMKDFSGIVEIVQGVFPPYGGIAIGTISALFVVAQHKEAMEGHLSTAIAGIKDRLPGLQMYRSIYSGGSYLEMDLRKQIVNVYAAFIDLSIEATEFYSDHGYYRWFIAMGNPNKFKEKADAVQEAVVQIRMRCEELLSENVHKVRKLNLKLIEDVSDLKSQVEQLQLNNNDAHLVQLQKSLGLGQWSCIEQRKELVAYRDALKSSNRDEMASKILEQMENARLQKFKQSGAYQSWHLPGLSRIMILVARNHEYARTRHCWASPIALSEIDHLEADSATYAYYTLPVMDRTSLHQVVPSILFQLLRLKRKVLGPGGRLDDLKSKIGEYENVAAATEDSEEKILSLHKVVTSVINYFEAGETVYIIVDRVDRCEEDQQLSLLQTLTQLIERGRCITKVLVIADTVGWSVDRKALLTTEKTGVVWVEEEQKILEEYY